MANIGGIMRYHKIKDNVNLNELKRNMFIRDDLIWLKLAIFFTK